MNYQSVTMVNGLKCTDMCRLSDCDNQASCATEENVDEQDYDEELEEDYEY